MVVVVRMCEGLEVAKDECAERLFASVSELCRQRSASDVQ